VRRWLTAGDFDVVHVHEPFVPSLSLLAVLAIRDEPVVATFHTAMTRSRAMYAVSGVLQLVLERLTVRIAVSPAARKVQVEHLGGDAWVIPNGVPVARYAGALPFPGWPGPGGTIGFLGRFTEPRKGFDILLDAFDALARERPDLRLLVAGPGDTEEALAGVAPEIADRITFLGLVDEEQKAQMLRSVDVYVAPNTGGESFGMILTEAMAAGTPVVASDLEAFRRVVEDAGVVFPVGSAPDLAQALGDLLDDPDRRALLVARGREVVSPYDWATVSRRVLEVYQMAIEAAPRQPRPVTTGAGRKSLSAMVAPLLGRRK
jgi:phosphatidylinositol alpha-mannosyltransferase